MPNLTQLPLNEEYNAALRHLSEFLPAGPQRGQKVRWGPREYTLNRKAVKDLWAVKGKPCPHVVNLHYAIGGGGLLLFKEHRPYLYAEHSDDQKSVPCPGGHFPHLKAWLLDRHPDIWCIFCGETPTFELFAQNLTPEFTGWFQEAEDLPPSYREDTAKALAQQRRLPRIGSALYNGRAEQLLAERALIREVLAIPPAAWDPYLVPLTPAVPPEPEPAEPELPAEPQESAPSAAAEPAPATPEQTATTPSSPAAVGDTQAEPSPETAPPAPEPPPPTPAAEEPAAAPLRPRQRGYQAQPLPPESKAAIRAARLAGDTLQAIADRHSVSRQYIHQLTRDLPGPHRPAPRRRHQEIEALNAAIVAAAKEGATAADIAQRLRVGKRRVSEQIQAAGLAQHEAARQLRSNPELQQELVAYYQDGHILTETAAKFGIGASTASRYLNAAGVMRDRSEGKLARPGRVDQTLAAQALESYKQGETPQRIAQELGISPAFVRSLAIKAGLDTSKAGRRRRALEQEQERQ